MDAKRQVAVGSGTLPIWEILGAATDALRVIELDDTEGDMLQAVGRSREFLLAGGRVIVGRTGPVGVGVIGAGVISETYLKNLTSFPDIDVLAVGDLVSGGGSAKAAEHSVPASGGVAAVLDHPDVEIVVNLTIPAAHAEVASRAIAAGGMCGTRSRCPWTGPAARQLLDAADAAGLRVGCAPDTFLGSGLQAVLTAHRTSE